MSDKQAMIKKLIEMQKQFIDYEHKNGLDPQDYYAPAGGHELDGYKEEYSDIALEVMNIAHKEVGSQR